jgi:hypothetical protein
MLAYLLYRCGTKAFGPNQLGNMRNSNGSLLQKLNKRHMLNRFSHKIMAESQDFILLKNNELDDSCEETPKGKKGAPRNEGMSTEVYENKGPKISCLGMSTELIENAADIFVLCRSC